MKKVVIRACVSFFAAKRDIPIHNRLAQVISALESSGLFNAGVGASPNAAYQMALDACVHSSHHGTAIVSNVNAATPSAVAASLLSSPALPRILTGEGATHYAREVGVPAAVPASLSQHTTPTPASQLPGDTIGALCFSFDHSEVLGDTVVESAVVVSTGGPASKPLGRMSPTVLPGVGWGVSGGRGWMSTGLGDTLLGAVSTGDGTGVDTLRVDVSGALCTVSGDCCWGGELLFFGVEGGMRIRRMKVGRFSESIHL